MKEEIQQLSLPMILEKMNYNVVEWCIQASTLCGED
jgi:hypothetical protein